MAIAKLQEIVDLYPDESEYKNEKDTLSAIVNFLKKELWVDGDFLMRQVGELVSDSFGEDVPDQILDHEVKTEKKFISDLHQLSESSENILIGALGIPNVDEILGHSTKKKLSKEDREKLFEYVSENSDRFEYFYYEHQSYLSKVFNHGRLEHLVPPRARFYDSFQIAIVDSQIYKFPATTGVLLKILTVDKFKGTRQDLNFRISELVEKQIDPEKPIIRYFQKSSNKEHEKFRLQFYHRYVVKDIDPTNGKERYSIHPIFDDSFEY